MQSGCWTEPCLSLSTQATEQGIIDRFDPKLDLNLGSKGESHQSSLPLSYLSLIFSCSPAAI